MKRKKSLLWAVLLMPYLGLLFIWQYYERQIARIDHSSFILVSKEDLTLKVFSYKGEKIAEYAIACGKNMGNKTITGDMKTPEGVFHVSDIQNSSGWSHDFGDGKGKITGAYGPYFIRLHTPGFSGIGIHGTHDSNSVGTRATEGCIRLKNEDLKKLVKQVKIGEVVIITPSKLDL